MSEFANEPLLELRRAPERELLLEGLRSLEPELPLKVPVWVGAERREGGDIVSTDPGEPDRPVALAAAATDGDVERAVEAAVDAFPAWSSRPAAQRADILLRAAAWMRERRARLVALEVRECA